MLAILQQPEHATLADARGLFLFYTGGALLLGILAALIHYLIRPRLPWRWPSATAAWRQLLLGVGCAFALLVVVVAVNFVAGSYGSTGKGYAAFHYVMTGDDTPAGWMVWLFFAAQGTAEELLFRGVGLALLAALFAWLTALLLDPHGTWREERIRRLLWFGAGIAANLVVSGAFAIVHQHNPAVTEVALFNIALAGFALGQLYWLQGRLWGACAMHICWNAGLASLGLPVSGVAVREPLIGSIRGSQPGILSGGEFGPEASVLASVMLTLISVWLVWQCWRSVNASTAVTAAERS